MEIKKIIADLADGYRKLTGWPKGRA